MADTKTADQWKQVVDNLQVQVEQVAQKKAEGEKQISDLNNQILAVRTQRQAIYDANGGNVQSNNAEVRALDRQEYTLNQELDRVTVYTRSTLTTENLKLKAEIRNANNQAEIAQDSPRGTIANPITQANPAPANPEPGNNTDVPALEETTPDSIDQELFPQTSTPEPIDQELFPSSVQTIDQELFPGAPGANEQQDEVSGVNRARSSGNEGRYVPFPEVKDYRVKISLAPSADYLYLDPDISNQPDNLLWPLIDTGGVIFPYTPLISVNYNANYAPTDLTHSNYKIYNYTGSSVDSLSITGDFTAQDVEEANYVLAVIHFFRSVTKMFYGRDQNRGVPPPLVYLTGHGEYGFDNHPMVITSFTLNYPQDVDYINAGPNYNVAAALNPYRPPNLSNSPSRLRLRASNLQLGGVQPPPTFSITSNTRSNITRVPTRISIGIVANPIVTRDSISNIFSLKDYGTGKLLRGSKNPRGGGIW